MHLWPTATCFWAAAHCTGLRQSKETHSLSHRTQIADTRALMLTDAEAAQIHARKTPTKYVCAEGCVRMLADKPHVRDPDLLLCLPALFKEGG